LAPALLDLGGGSVHQFLIVRLRREARCDDIGAGLGEAQAQGAPDAGGPSGYNCNFAFKAE
jgi:hypothetical protein